MMVKRTIINVPNRIKARLLPPEKTRFALGGVVYEVCHRNEGQTRFSAKFIGTMKQTDNKDQEPKSEDYHPKNPLPSLVEEGKKVLTVGEQR
jgi:hypothetical protein